MEPAYRDEYAASEETHGWFRARRAVLDRLLPPSDGTKRILDLGAGTGATTRWLSSRGRVVSLDLVPPSGVDRAVAGDALHLPFRDASFDWVVALDLLEHLPDDAGALREARRVLRPGGRLLLTVPAAPWLMADHDRANRHLRRYDAAGLKGLAREGGWTLKTLTHFQSGLLLPAALLRIPQRLLGSSGSGSDLGRTRWVPDALWRALSGPGPFGLSLYAELEPA